jgi:phosphatidate cytidylyltransferase
VARDEEQRTEGEDLFEDLDKFFAPIQDVEWPESTGPVARPPERASEAEGESSRGATMAVETETATDEVIELEPAPEPEPPVEAPEMSEPFDPPESGDAAPGSWAGAGEDEGDVDDGGVGTFLFEAEADQEELELEDAGSASAGYVDLPGPDPDEPEVAELDEGTGPEIAEEAPDIQAVEAAADHFAESVRDEVTIEPEPAVPEATEEVAIAALLGDEDAEEESEPARTVRVGAEGFGGPSWQEPTAIEVGADTERAGAGRDVPTAFLTGIILVALAVGAIALGPGPFAIFAGIVVLFAQGEFYLALQKRHYQPATALGLVSGALVLGAGYYRGENAMLAIMALSIFATFLWYMTVPSAHRRNVVSNVALTVLGIAYIPLLAAYALAVLKLPDGEGLTLSIIGLTFAYDTAAFGVGYFWGSRPLAPNISPKKSWEGAIGATLVVIALAVGVVANSVTLLDTVGRSVGLAVVVAVFAPLSMRAFRRRV